MSPCHLLRSIAYVFTIPNHLHLFPFISTICTFFQRVLSLVPNLGRIPDVIVDAGIVVALAPVPSLAVVEGVAPVPAFLIALWLPARLLSLSWLLIYLLRRSLSRVTAALELSFPTVEESLRGGAVWHLHRWIEPLEGSEVHSCHIWVRILAAIRAFLSGGELL